jgi:2-oxoglutarate dehydrogenase E1 component
VPDKFAIDWTPYINGKLSDPAETGVACARTPGKLAKQINTLPDGLKLHPRVAKIYEDRPRWPPASWPMDWGFAENLAYATLLDEGYKLRLVGQDCRPRHLLPPPRGAARPEHRRDPPAAARAGEEPEHVTIIDSLLSEEAVMAFEYGFATADPTTLTIWEGQFGDFANGAQVVIDQFISSGEAKWGRLCGLVLFLPHGYEGQGPEHSSARLERFLQLCALDNMQVCTPTTPAQMFHMIRRQMKRRARKPLVVMTPKSMLRHKLSVSTLDDLANGGFQNLIPTPGEGPEEGRRVVVCSGKVYYDLLEDTRSAA